MTAQTLSDTAKSDPVKASEYYDEKYFEWQKQIGEFGGWANSAKFVKTINPTDTVLDFGCGGGYLLNKLQCARRIGIEPNESACATLDSNGVEHFRSSASALEALGAGVANVIISNHALEHTLNPLQELKELRALLKDGGRIHFVVPCDSIRYRYNPKDVNYHLFSWSPQNLGNLFTEAGFTVEYARPLIHKWPPGYRQIAKLGRPVFDLVCRVYGRLERTWFQVEVLGKSKVA